MQKLKGRGNMGLCCLQGLPELRTSIPVTEVPGPSLIWLPCTRMGMSGKKEKLWRSIGFVSVSQVRA